MSDVSQAQPPPDQLAPAPGQPPVGAQPHDVDELFPPRKEDVDTLFPPHVEQDHQRQVLRHGLQSGTISSRFQDLLFGEEGPVVRGTESAAAIAKTGWEAFKEGAAGGWESLSLSPEHEQELTNAGVLNDYRKGEFSFGKAINRSILNAPAFVWAVANGFFSAAPEVVARFGYEAGAPQFGREIANIPQAFMGTPHPMGVPELTPGRLASAIERQQERGRLPQEAAKPVEPVAPAAPTPEGAEPAPPAPAAAPVPEPAAPAAPDIHTTVREAEPKLFEEYDALSARREILRRFIEEREDTGKSTGDLARVASNLKETEARLHELAPQVEEAYQKATAPTEAAPTAAPEATAAAAAPTPSTPAAAEAPPVPEGHVRFYHGGPPEGGEPPTTGGGRWATPNLEYARQYRAEEGKPGQVWYADIPKKDFETRPELAAGFDETNNYYRHFEVPEDIAKQMRPYGEAAAEIGPDHPIVAEETRRNMAAGIPRPEAQAAAAVQAHMWETRAARFNGAKGTAAEMYAREAPEVQGGPGVRPVTPEVIARAEEALRKAEEAVPSPPEPSYRPRLVAQGLDPSDAVKRQWAESSPIKTIDDLFTHAQENQDALARVGDQVASELGIQFRNAKIKGRPRTQEKIDGGKAPGRINDVVRGGFSVDTPAQADAVVARFAQHFETIDEGWAVTPVGYFDRKVLVRFENGQVGEIQIWHPDVLRAKKDKGHKLYVEWRGLPLDDPRRPDLNQQMQDVYADALRDAGPEWKALFGRGGSEGNLASNAALESTRPPMAISAPSARDQALEPSRTIQASPDAYAKGSPSNEPYTGSATSASTENIAIPGDAVIPPPDRAVPLSSPLGNAVRMFSPGELKVDAKRFQFKEGGDEAGVTDRLKGVKTWDPIKAGMVLVWEDKAGQHFIVDGHQRHGLASRIAGEDPAQNPQLLARVLREAEGVKDKDARTIAALKNIAEGTGTAVDAAKVLRDDPDLAGELPPRSELVRQARGLVNLSNDAFGMVINDVVPPNYAALVGQLVPQNPELQSALLGLLAKTEPANAVQAEAIVRQGIEAGTARKAEAAQGGLFGDEDVATSLYLDRAKVLDKALKEIKRDKTVFSVLTKEQSSIEAAGNKLAADINQKRAAADAQALQVLQTLASRKGPVSDALGDAAKRARADGKPGPAVRGFIAQIRAMVESGQLARLADGLERGPTHVGAEDAASVVERAPERGSVEAEDTSTKEVDEVLFQVTHKPKLIVARKFPDGRVIYGKRGQVHSSLLTEEEYWGGRIAPDIDEKQMGFATESGGKFMSRREAKQWAKENEPRFAPFAQPGEGLEASSYQRVGTRAPDPEFFQKRKAAANQEDLFAPRAPDLFANIGQRIENATQRVEANPADQAARQELRGLVDQTKIGPQNVLPGMERTAVQAAASREAAGGLRSEKTQQEPGGLFAEREKGQTELFQSDEVKPRIVSSAKMQEAVLRNEWARNGADLDYEDIWEKQPEAWDNEARAWNKEHPDQHVGVGDEKYTFGDVPEFERRFEDKYLKNPDGTFKKRPFPGVKKANEYFEQDYEFDKAAYLQGEEPTELFQRPAVPTFQRGGTKKGSYRPSEDPAVRDVITYFKDADASTLIHEPAHGWLNRMMKDAADEAAPDQLKADAKTTLDWLGIEKSEDLNERTAAGKLTARARKANEKFARGFEAYVMEGWAPSQALVRVFEQFRQWLAKIYGTLKKLEEEAGFKIGLTDEMRAVFDRLIAEKPRQRTVIAAEGERGPSLADIHEDDAEVTHPEHAHPAAETIQAERDSLATEKLLDAENARLENVAPETRGREAGGPQPDRNGPQAGPVTGAGEASARAAAVGAGGGEAAAEGAGPSALEGKPGPTVKNPTPITAHDRFESEKAGNIRLENVPLKDISDPEAFRDVIRKAAVRNDNFLTERRGEISNAESIAIGEAMGMDPSWLDKKAIGQAFNAQEIFAVEFMLNKSATAVKEAATRAASGNVEDIFAYEQEKARLQMFHDTVQGKASAARAEAGRALQSYAALARMAKRVAGTDAGQLLQEITGQTLFQMQREAKYASKLYTPQMVAKFMNDSTKNGFQDKIIYYYINALISGPITHLRYSVGNFINAIEKPLFEIPLQALSGATWGRVREQLGYTASGDRVYLGEAGAQLYALGKGSRDGLSAAIEAFTSGVSPPLPGERLTHAFDLRQPIPGAIGTAIGVPGRSVSAIHSFFKSIRYEQEIAGLAYRQAMKEDLSGDAFTNRVAELHTNPTAPMMEAATKAALRELYMSPTEYSTFMGNLTRAINQNLVAKIMAPFVKIGTQIQRNAIVERTPLGVFSREVRANLLLRGGEPPELTGTAVGPGAAQDIQIGKIGVGTALIGTAIGMAAEGLMTSDGPVDPDKRRVWLLSHRPNSIQVGGVTIPYQGLGHLGMLMKFGANMYDSAHAIDTDDEWTKTAWTLFEGISRSALDENFLRGVKDALDAIYHPQEYGDHYIKQFATNWIPFSVGLGQVAREVDPWQREAQTLSETAQAKMPLLSEMLLPKRDMFGEPIPSNPTTAAQRYQDDPVVQAMDELHIGVGKLHRKVEVQGVQVEFNNEQYDDYARIAGRMAKMRLNQMVALPGWSQIPPGIRIDMIKKTIEKQRENAARLVKALNAQEIIIPAQQKRLERIEKVPVH